MILHLARCRTPAEVAVLMREEFELEITIPQVVKYDPRRPSYEAGEKWLPLFEAARTSYLKDVEDVPIANQGFRLQTLQEGLEVAKKAKNWKLVAELMEQAAKEVGGVLTNERNLRVRRDDVPDTPEDRAAALAALVGEALDKRAAKQPTLQ